MTNLIEDKRKYKAQTCQNPNAHPLMSLLLWRKNGDRVLLCLASSLATVVRQASRQADWQVDKNLSLGYFF